MGQKNIPSIYNFCDRWCERCTFTNRCAVYQDEKQENAADHDLKNQAFWERLSANFTKAKTLLEEVAKKSGVDLDALEGEMEEEGKKMEERRKVANEHVAHKLSHDYTMTAQTWLKTQPGMLDRLETMKTDLTLGVESQETAKEQVAMIKESLSVIEWYSIFISTKVHRALMSKQDDIWKELGEDQSDYNGSAKIALIAIERSSQAWANVFEILPDQEDHFLNILALLEKIRKELLKEFPKAMEFIRPGFDQPASTRK